MIDTKKASVSTCNNYYGVTDSERTWRASVLKGDFVEMSRLLSANPKLANWRDYITGNTALHFAAQTNEKSLVLLLAGTYKANVDARNHGGLTPLHMAAVGVAEEVAFLLMSQFQAKASIRDYSGRLPINYLTSNQVGDKLRSKLQSAVTQRLINLGLSAYLQPESTEAPNATAVNSSALALKGTNSVRRSRGDTSRRASPPPLSNKRTDLFSCGSFRRSKSRKKTSASNRQNHPTEKNEPTPPSIRNSDSLCRDDLPPATATPVSGFAHLDKLRVSTRRRHRLPGDEALAESETTDVIFASIRRRKTERGENYNPMNPDFQQTTFRKPPTSLKNKLNISQQIPSSAPQDSTGKHTEELSQIHSRIDLPPIPRPRITQTNRNQPI